MCALPIWRISHFRVSIVDREFALTALGGQRLPLNDMLRGAGLGEDGLGGRSPVRRPRRSRAKKPVFGSHFRVDLRLPGVRLSRPANQRFVSVAPNMRRSLLRRSVFLRNLHEQFLGIVQAAKGRRGASRSK